MAESPSIVTLGLDSNVIIVYPIKNIYNVKYVSGNALLLIYLRYLPKVLTQNLYKILRKTVKKYLISKYSWDYNFKPLSFSIKVLIRMIQSFGLMILKSQGRCETIIFVILLDDSEFWFRTFKICF